MPPKKKKTTEEKYPIIGGPLDGALLGYYGIEPNRVIVFSGHRYWFDGKRFKHLGYEKN